MYMFDASSIIYAWDNYPIENFPPLWEWIESEMRTNEFRISQVAFAEVERKLPECGKWLKDAQINRDKLTNEILQEAQAIKTLLGIADDNYHPKGVGENDLLIIASAKVSGGMLVSEESSQPILPPTTSRYKIPAVCNLAAVNVDSVQFIDLIRGSGEVF